MVLLPNCQLHTSTRHGVVTRSSKADGSITVSVVT